MASTLPLMSAGPSPAGSMLTIWIFVASMPAPLTKAGPLQEHSAACSYRDGFAFEILRRLDAGIGEGDDGGRPAPKNAADGFDRHALGDAVGGDKAVGEADLRRLAGDQLRGAGRAFSGGDRNVEPGFAIKALFMRHDEAAIASFIEPIESHRHRLEQCIGADPQRGTG
jgi:hypothetical protein